jgi:hypothetical protein
MSFVRAFEPEAAALGFDARARQEPGGEEAETLSRRRPGSGPPRACLELRAKSASYAAVPSASPARRPTDSRVLLNGWARAKKNHLMRLGVRTLHCGMYSGFVENGRSTPSACARSFGLWLLYSTLHSCSSSASDCVMVPRPSLAGGEDRKFDLRRKADLGATRRGDRRLRSRLGPTPTLRGRVARQPAACAHHPDAHALKIRGRHPSARLVWRASGPRKPFPQGQRDFG